MKKTGMGGMMKLTIALMVALISQNAFAQGLAINSLNCNGLITWSNAPEYSNRTYRIEWSDNLMSGEWSATWAALTNIPHSEEGMSAAVPMFYQVAMNPRTIVVATNGNDVSGLGTSNFPFATIQKAIDVAAESDVIFVQGGIYSGAGNRNLRIDGKNIDVISESGPTTTIIDCEGASRGITFSGTMTNALFAGFTIQNGYLNEGGDWGPGGIVVVADDAAPIIDRCIIVSNRVDSSYFTAQPALITFKTRGAAVVRNCLMTSNTINGGSWAGGGYGAIIRTYDEGGMTNTFVYNCTLANNTLTGFLRSSLRFCSGTIINVIDWNNPGAQIWEGTVAGSFTRLLSDTMMIPNVITNDPLFVSGGNYSLQAGSPAINVGTNMPWMVDAKDIADNDRIMGGTVDLGAYEAP